jgi:hypothetical protein
MIDSLLIEIDLETVNDGLCHLLAVNLANSTTPSAELNVLTPQNTHFSYNHKKAVNFPTDQTCRFPTSLPRSTPSKTTQAI